MIYRKLASDNPEKEYQNNYHGHPKYFNTYLIVLSLFFVTLLPNLFGIPAVPWIVFIIFSLSTWKASLVLSNFMHLRFEPNLIWIILFISVSSLVLLFFLVYPDIPPSDSASKPMLNSYTKNNIIYYQNDSEAEEDKKLQIFDLSYIKKKLGYLKK